MLPSLHEVSASVGDSVEDAIKVTGRSIISVKKHGTVYTALEGRGRYRCSFGDD